MFQAQNLAGVVEALLSSLDEIGFADPDGEVNGGDCVEVINQHLSELRKAVRNASAEAEVFPGATRAEIGQVMMQDVVGDYEVPENVPEWVWVEKAASFAHVRNGQSGVWEFVLNLSLAFEDVPDSLKPVLESARQSHLSYLVFHQGT